jgi:hypothetical protein
LLIALTGCIVHKHYEVVEYWGNNDESIEDTSAVEGSEEEVDGTTDEDADGTTDEDADGTTDEDADGTTDEDADGDGSSDDGSGDDPMLESIDITCDVGNWHYKVSTAIATESAAITVTETAADAAPTEFHTLTMASASSSGGEDYERDLLLVTAYYFEDVATQFACVDGTNLDLTWQIDLYSDAARTVSIGCVTWGHDTSAGIASGCQAYED